MYNLVIGNGPTTMMATRMLEGTAPEIMGYVAPDGVPDVVRLSELPTLLVRTKWARTLFSSPTSDT